MGDPYYEPNIVVHDMPFSLLRICPELFAVHGEEKYYSIIKYCSVPFM